jgi:hypothetical protein
MAIACHIATLIGVFAILSANVFIENVVATLRPIRWGHALTAGGRMNIARLGAAGGAAAIVALSAAGPAFAADPAPPTGSNEPVPSAPPTSEPPSTPPTTPPGTPPGHKPPGHGPSASVSPTVFSPGDTLTFTVQHCAVRPNISDLNHLFASVSPFHHTGWRDYAASGVTRTNLVEGRIYRVTIHCGRWSETFSTKPRTRTTPPSAPGEPTGVPSGAPQTGDGSSGGGHAGLVAGGTGIVLAGLAGGTYLYTRRRSPAGN